MEITTTEPELCMTFIMVGNRTHDFLFVVNNKSDADILKKEFTQLLQGH